MKKQYLDPEMEIESFAGSEIRCDDIIFDSVGGWGQNSIIDELEDM